MKKLLFIVFVFFTISIQSQEIQFGAKAGVNLASVGSDDESDVNVLTSFHIGGLLEIPITQRFSVQPELLYSGQGAKISRSLVRDDYHIEASAKIKLDYLNLPILAKYYVLDNFSLEAGPQIGLLLTANNETDINIDGNLPPELRDIIYGELESGSGDIKDQCETLEFSLGFGVSYKFGMGAFLGARYNLGFSNIYKDDTRGLKNKNSVLQLSVGYTF